jgi:uncharacterized hydrophobic protein (TIGR00271 family)
MAKPILFTSFFEQRKSVEHLVEESRADGDYYLFLTFGAFITTLGLLINNPVVIVGAMLVAPILFPILALGMGVVTASREAISRSVRNLAKSIILVVIVSALTAFLINQTEVTEQLVLVSSPNFLFFLIAFFSGVVAAYSWAKQNVSATLPGVAITVSLLPPISAVGIAMTLGMRDVFSGSLMLFFINLLGIALASIVVFSLFGFSALGRFQDEKIEEEIKEEGHNSANKQI